MYLVWLHCDDGTARVTRHRVTTRKAALLAALDTLPNGVTARRAEFLYLLTSDRH